MILTRLNQKCLGDYLLMTITGDRYFLHLAHDRKYLRCEAEAGKPVESPLLKPIYRIERLRVGARALFVFMPKSRDEKLVVWPTEKILTITTAAKPELAVKS